MDWRNAQDVIFAAQQIGRDVQVVKYPDHATYSIIFTSRAGRLPPNVRVLYRSEPYDAAIG